MTAKRLFIAHRLNRSANRVVVAKLLKVHWREVKCDILLLIAHADDEQQFVFPREPAQQEQASKRAEFSVEWLKCVADGKIYDSHVHSDGVFPLLQPQNAAVNQVDEELVSGRLLVYAPMEIDNRDQNRAYVDRYWGGTNPGSQCVITPVRALQVNGQIYVTAKCNRSDCMRTFRLDRLGALRLVR